MRRWLCILDIFGKVLALFGALMLMPAGVSLLYGDGLSGVFLQAALVAIVCGATLWLAGRRYRADLHAREGFLLVLALWALLPLFAALPLALALPSLDFSEAFFEAASGLTASGGTVLSGLDKMAPSLLFWRGEMIWFGGMGLIVLALAILPFLGVGGRQLFQTEMPGPMKDQKLTPQIAQTAKGLWLVYCGLTATCALAYKIAGMNWLDAVVHGFTTLGLGGFSSHDASFAYFDSPAIEAVAIFFMVLAGMNFATHFAAIAGGGLRAYAFDLECRAYLSVLAAAVVVVAVFLWASGEYQSPLAALRFAAFNTVSIVTTTGYSNADFNAWPLFAPLLMLLLANCTACGGSTGGGIKMMRALIAWRQAGSERLKLIHPQAYYDNKTGGRPVPNRIIISVLFFILAYIAGIIALMVLLAAGGMDFLTAFSAAAASISNTGPGLGEVGPAANYAHLSPYQTWLCSFGMLLGRLELLAFLVVLHRSFWRY
jgi:trk system potassium uptake protein TrkH